MDGPALLVSLGRRARGEVRGDRASRELYAHDASIYRRLPAATLRAADADDLDAAVAACRESGVPLTMRGGGTSLGGQAVGTGLVVDATALAGIAVDPDARVARVGPGAVLDDLNRAAAEHGLLFGPDVASGSRATLGGMIANNSAGARSIEYGLTADHVLSLDVTLADGTRATLRRGAAAPPALEAARPLAAGFRPPALLRRVSGYALDALAGDDPDWPRLLCGSEGTLAVIRGAELRLVPRPQARGLALMSFDSVDAALEATLRALEAGPSAVELMGAAALDADAEAQLLVEHSGAPEEVEAALRALPGARVVLDGPGQAAVWAVRRAGIGRHLGERPPGPGDPKPLAFIEDPAVPPERLPELARGIRRILDREGTTAVWYGHASVGCLHIRPRMDLRLPGATASLRRIAEETADLVVALGGSLSGEHGDGRARSELLPRMYPPETIAAFGRLKELLDPERLLNPGVLTDPDPLDAGLKMHASPPRHARRTALSFAAEGGLPRAGEACNGNGACRSSGTAMCPSYQALRDERHATRGRAVLLRAAIEGRLPGGLADDGLHEALELCLACKACATECPAQVDVSRMKAEALAHRHRARGVPVRARALGHAHDLLALGARAPRLARWAGGVAGRFMHVAPPMPERPWRPDSDPDADMVVMADTFTRYVEPGIGEAALRVLRAAGVRTGVADPGCCGRPLLSQGLVGPARRRARAALGRLAPHAVAGRRIVVLEPSCWSMLVDDIPALLPGDPRARWVADASVGFERAVAEAGAPPLRDDPSDVVAHDHCHTRALGGGEEGVAALAAAGVRARPSGAGCCGMAGAFGHVHPALSARIAEDRLAPAVRGADAAIAAGTSCREQIRRITGREALHPAQHMAARLS
ncbi:MAG TPA: FAD-binding and (Fe-S)-binding domain-containing protein [Miltoncostaeaceae bacterium]|nr:FAD-binding and (Fe-S)-binding domain-containing protein [Miltoncostaeaceae bacterium]